MKTFYRSIVIVLLASVSAGLYGAIHDQVSYTISPEYFTNIKFEQFSWLRIGVGDRTNAAIIGYIATCWFGGICGMIVAYRLRSIDSASRAFRLAAVRLGLVLATSALLAFGVSIYTWVLQPAELAAHWQHTADHYMIQDSLGFAVVAQMHRMSYVGGAVGILWLLLPVKSAR